MMSGWEVLTLLTLIWCLFLTLWRVVDAMTISNLLIAALNGRTPKLKSKKWSNWGFPLKRAREPELELEPNPISGPELRIDSTKNFRDLTSALVNMGYSKAQATVAAREVIFENKFDAKFDELLKAALKSLRPAAESVSP